MAPFRVRRCPGSLACQAQKQVAPEPSGTAIRKPFCVAPLVPTPAAAVRATEPVIPSTATVPATATPAGQEPAPGSPAALALLASLGIAPRAKAGRALGPDDQRFSPVTISHLTHRLMEVKQLLDQLTAEQKELHETLRLAHLRGDLLHLVPPGQEAGTHQLPEGPTLHRRAGRKQWHYSEVVGELEAQLKARQVYEQSAGVATTSYGASFWEMRFPKG
jgi:hypothetical protein